MVQDKIIIITAPSGSGKTTLVKRLLEDCPHLQFSVSACTREPRKGETNGKDYYFYSEEEFKELIASNAFVEWEMVYTGKYYGTLVSELQRIWEQKHIPLVDIDVQGALAIRDKYPDQCLTLFIETPSLHILRERLMARGTETAVSLEERVSKAAHELTFSSEFDRIIINDNLDRAEEEIKLVVNAFAGC